MRQARTGDARFSTMMRVRSNFYFVVKKFGGQTVVGERKLKNMAVTRKEVQGRGDL